jgi:hypothetical protein
MSEFKIGLGNPIETNLEPMKTYGVLNSDNTVRHSYLTQQEAINVASGLNSLNGINPSNGVQTTLDLYKS